MGLKKNIKIIAYSVIVFFFLTGFTIWEIFSNDISNIFTKKLINSRCIEIGELSFSEYCETGFVNDYSVSNEAHLNFMIKVNLADINDKYITNLFNNKIKMQVKLSYQKSKRIPFDIISNSYLTSNYTYSIDDTKKTVDIESINEVNDKIISSNFIITYNRLSEVNYIYVNCDCVFDVTNYLAEDSFYEKIVCNLEKTGIPFNVKAIIK